MHDAYLSIGINIDIMLFMKLKTSKIEKPSDKSRSLTFRELLSNAIKKHSPHLKRRTFLSGIWR